MEQAKKKKSRRIFRMFLLPLVVILLAQAFISYGTVTFSGTFAALQNYSEGQFEQAIENRRLLLENTLTQQETGLQGAAAQMPIFAKENLCTSMRYIGSQAKKTYMI